MSDIKLTASKSEMGYLFKLIKEDTNLLIKELSLINDLNLRVVAIEQADDLLWRRLSFSEFNKEIHILSQFSYKIGQNSKEVLKLPAVVQLDPVLHINIFNLLNRINGYKDQLAIINKELKFLYKRDSNKIWQSVTSYASIIQILRKISTHHIPNESCQYLGLSYLTKPVSKKMTKDEASIFVSSKLESFIKSGGFGSKSELLLDLQNKIKGLPDDTRFVLARNGAPRYMLNVRSCDNQFQYMASLPVFVFTKKIIDVSLPSGIKRKPRSDKKIPIGITPNDFGLYIMS